MGETHLVSILYTAALTKTIFLTWLDFLDLSHQLRYGQVVKCPCSLCSALSPRQKQSDEDKTLTEQTLDKSYWGKKGPFEGQKVIVLAYSVTKSHAPRRHCTHIHIFEAAPPHQLICSGPHPISLL